MGELAHFRLGGDFPDDDREGVEGRMGELSCLRAFDLGGDFTADV